MKGSVKRKCLCCRDFYSPDPRNVHHQRYCSKQACRKESKAESQRRWLQCPENQNYFRESENHRRVKDWRKVNPGYWRKKKSSTQVPLQEVFQAQVAHNEEGDPNIDSAYVTRSLLSAITCRCGTYLHDDWQCVTRTHSIHCAGAGTQRAGHPGDETGIPNQPALPMNTKSL